MGGRYWPGWADCGCPSSGCLISPAPTPGATLNVYQRARFWGTSGPITTASFTIPPSSPGSTTVWSNAVYQLWLGCDDFTYKVGADPASLLDATRGVITFTASPWQVHFLAHDHASSTGFRYVELTLTI